MGNGGIAGKFLIEFSPSSSCGRARATMSCYADRKSRNVLFLSLNSGAMSTVLTSSIRPEMPLRKRIRALERASSLAADAKIIPEMKHDDSVEDIAPSSFTTDYESQSDTSGSDNGDDKVDDDQEHPEGLEEHEHRRHSQDDDSSSTRSRAWYEFDLAVVVALVSPVGNWLTGGDHIKNLLLIVLLILYLHQIIESMIFIFISYTERY